MDCCLICFRLVSPDENNLLNRENKNDEEKLEDFHRFFKMLNRHLKIDRTKTKVIDDRNETIVFCNFGKAPACEECWKAMSSFCEVYHKIKTLELVLNQKLRTLMNIMFCAGKVPARVACFKETLVSKLDTSGASADEKINEILQYKKLLMGKCTEKLSGTYPKLILKRITHLVEEEEQNPAISEKVSLSSPSLSNSGPTSATVFEDEAPSVESDATSQVDTADFSAPSSPVVDYVSDCKLEAIDEKIHIRHLNNQEEETNDEFSIEVEDVKPNHIFSEVKAKVPSTRRSLRAIHKCNKCGRTFSTFEKLSCHQSSETCKEEKQSKIESDPEQDDEADNLFKNESESSSTEEEDVKLHSENQSKIKKVKSSAKRRKRHSKKVPRIFPKNICPVCQKVISTVPNSSATAKDEVIGQHILQEHPEAFKTAGSPQPFSCPVFYCPFSFDNVRSLTNHCSAKHKSEFKLRLRYEVKDHLERDLEKPLHCPFPNCDAACLTRAILTIHIKTAHESDPKTLIILSREFFANRMKSMEKKVKTLSSQLNKDSDGEKEELKLRKLRTKCPECSNFFSTFYEMIFHRKNVHLDSGVAETLSQDKLTIEILNLRKETFEDGENDHYLKIEIGCSKIFSCSEGNPPCGQLFLFKEDLEAHRKLHGEFKCHLCEFTDVRKTLLNWLSTN